MFGKKHDEETIKKIKEKRNQVVIQEKMNQISKELNSKSVLQFTLDGDFLKEYSSIKEASIETGLSESIIGKCCRGVIKNPRKFFFKFKDSNSLILRNSFKIKIDDLFEIYNLEYRLKKRNKSSVIVERENQLFTFRQKDYPFLFEKIKLEL